MLRKLLLERTVLDVPVHAVAWHPPAGQRIAIGTTDVVVVETATWERIARFAAAGAVACPEALADSDGGSLLVLAGTPGEGDVVKAWGAADGERAFGLANPRHAGPADRSEARVEHLSCWARA